MRLGEGDCVSTGCGVSPKMGRSLQYRGMLLAWACNWVEVWWHHTLAQEVVHAWREAGGAGEGGMV